METLKKFWLYFLMLVGFFIFITILTNITMRENYKNIANYEIKSNNPEIKVTDFKSTYTHGYINGTVTNNTGEHLPLKYLEISFFDKDGIYLGTKYKELKYFNVNETINFEINYNYNNIDKAILNITDEMTKKEENNIIDAVFKNTDEETIKIAGPIAGALVLCTVLP